MKTSSTIRRSTYAWDFENRLSSVGGGAYGYDADGNLTSKQSGGAWIYSYDDENRLTAVSGPTGRWTYQYDALGNRVAQTNGTTNTQYLVDPTGMGSVVAEFGGSGNLVNHFTYGLGLTSSLPASGSAQFYQFDGSANTVAVTGAGGAVLDTYYYLPFGEKVGTGSVPNPFTYAGQLGISDDGDGLYYMRARYYDPAIGRFISEDPIGLRGGINLYRYVHNSPVNLIDPLGLTDANGTHLDGDFMYDGSGKRVGLAPPEVLGIQPTYIEFDVLMADQIVSDTAKMGKSCLFGNRRGLNAADSLRIGWSWVRNGEYWRFRITGKWLEEVVPGGHINLWPVRLFPFKRP